MVNVSLVYPLLLVIFCASLQGAAFREECDASEDCVPISGCPWIKYIFDKNLNNIELNEFMAENICDFEETEAKLCCDRNIGPCVTPDQGEGLCAHPSNCIRLAELVGQVHDERTSNIRKSQCSFGNNGQVQVCCPLFLNSTTIAPVPDGLPNKCGLQKTKIRIFGGSLTDFDEFPWTALLEYGDFNKPSLICGATLISSRFVLTAAHCVRSAQATRFGAMKRVRLGEHDVSSTRDCVPGSDEDCAPPIIRAEVESIELHENYSPRSMDTLNDIALVKLKEPVAFSDFVAPICLPINQVKIPKTLYATGWGRTENGSGSDIKLKVQLPLFSKENCTKIYRDTMRWSRTLGPNQICAGGEDGKDICVGDSGGPLMASLIVSSNEVWYQYGIVSIGAQRCADGTPSVFTSVTDYIPWIIEKMKNM